jgi:dolichol kinase
MNSAELSWNPPNSRIWRNLFHLGNAIIIAACLVWVGRRPVTVALITALLFAYFLDVLRFRYPVVRSFFFKSFAPFLSERELTKLSSSTWYLLGTLGTILLYPSDVAVCAILVLGCCDPFASLIGRRWGRIKVGSGTTLGLLAFACTAFIIITPQYGILTGLIGSIVSAGVEVSFSSIDDNLTIPVTTGATIWVLTGLGSV